MSRLTKWIESTYKPKKLESKSTCSMYYYFFGGGYSIRVSDHMFNEEHACDMNITYSASDKHLYTVMLKGYRNVLTFDYQKVKGFIEYTLLMWKLNKSRQNAISEIKQLQQEKKDAGTLFSCTKREMLSYTSEERTSYEKWQYIVDNFVINDISEWQYMNKEQRRCCKVLFANKHNLHYYKCVGILKKILASGEMNSAYLTQEITKYLSAHYPEDYPEIEAEKTTG